MPRLQEEGGHEDEDAAGWGRSMEQPCGSERWDLAAAALKGHPGQNQASPAA